MDNLSLNIDCQRLYQLQDAPKGEHVVGLEVSVDFQSGNVPAMLIQVSIGDVCEQSVEISGRYHIRMLYSLLKEALKEVDARSIEYGRAS